MSQKNEIQSSCLCRWQIKPNKKSGRSKMVKLNNLDSLFGLYGCLTLLPTMQGITFC